MPAAAQNRGHLELVVADGEPLLSREFGSSGSVLYDVMLLAGRYNVRFVGNPALCLLAAVPDVPCNGGTLQSALAIIDDSVLDLDLRAVRVSGSVSLRSGALPAESDERGRIAFVDRDGRKVLAPALGTAGAYQYELTLWPGTYDVLYEANPLLCRQAQGTTMPCTGGVIESNLAISSDGVLNIDIPAVRVSGAITVNGQALPSESGQRGKLHFVAENGERLVTSSFTTSGAVSYEVSLWPGEYAIAFEANEALCPGERAPGIPCIDGTVNAAADLRSDGVLDLDLPEVRVSGAITLNGAPLAIGSGDRGALAFRHLGQQPLGQDDDDDADVSIELRVELRAEPRAELRVELGPDRPDSYDLSLFDGSYSIAYRADPLSCDSLPCNDQLLAGCEAPQQ